MGESGESAECSASASASAKPSDEIWAKLGNPFSLFHALNYPLKFQTLGVSLFFPSLGFHLNSSNF